MRSLITVILAVVLAAVLAATARAQETVRLRNGTTFDGAVLVRLTPATYLIQTRDVLYQVTEDELTPGSLATVEAADKDRPPLVTHSYDEIHADGTVTTSWSLPLTNDGPHAITETRWGLAPWERSHAAHRRYVDDRGVALTPTYSPPMSAWAEHPDGRVQVTLPLAVPLAPGEKMTLIGSETTDGTKAVDTGRVYTHVGDYAEDRVVWRKVRLPQGATLVRATPQPSARFTSGGYEYVMWRHFYRKGEKFPLEVFYRLPD